MTVAVYRNLTQETQSLHFLIYGSRLFSYPPSSLRSYLLFFPFNHPMIISLRFLVFLTVTHYLLLSLELQLDLILKPFNSNYAFIYLDELLDEIGSLGHGHMKSQKKHFQLTNHRWLYITLISYFRLELLAYFSSCSLVVCISRSSQVQTFELWTILSQRLMGIVVVNFSRFGTTVAFLLNFAYIS